MRAVCKSNLNRNLNFNLIYNFNILSYNIGWLKKALINSDFIEYINKFDIFFLFETHIMKEHEHKILKFFDAFQIVTIPAIRESLFGRASGGCLYGINSKFSKNVRFTRTANPNLITVSLVSPTLSFVPIYINGNNWNCNFQNLIESFPTQVQNCIFLGDVNARIGNLQSISSCELSGNPLLSHKDLLKGLFPLRI